MSPSRYKRTIKITSFFIISIIIVMLIYVINSNIFLQYELKSYLFSLLEERLEQHSKDINNEIEETISMLSELAGEISNNEIDDFKELAYVLSPIKEILGFRSIAIADLEGVAYTSDGQKINLADTEYFQLSIESGGVVSKIVNSKLDNRYINVYSVPIYRDKEIVGALCATKLSQEFYKSLQLTDTLSYMDKYIVDSEGDVIAASTGHSFYNSFNVFDRLESLNVSHKKINEMKQNFLSKKHSSTELNLDGVNYYFYYGHLGDSDWILINALPVSELAKIVAPISFNFIILSSILVIVVILGSSILIVAKSNSFKYLETVAYVDELTGGKNIKYLRDQFQNFLKKYSPKNCAVVVVNVHQFEVLNKILSSRDMELNLKKIYKVLLSESKRDEMIAHGDRDEFICIWTVQDMIHFEQRLRMLMDKFKDINLVVGGYLVEDSLVKFDEAINNAKIAQSKVELNQEIGYLLYRDVLGEEEVKKKELEESIREAILNREFIAWYQPKYAKDGETILGAEALIRWKKGNQILSPVNFIPLSEDIGLIGDIDEVMFEKICQDLKKWIEKGINLVPISVNLSRSYLTNLDHFNKLENYMKRYSIRTELIQFEITESAELSDDRVLQDVIKIIRDRGFKILLDDFGVGYSSIKSISTMNFDVLKLDKSFIDGIGTTDGEAILRYTINMAKELNMKIVAEGVETKEQYKFLYEYNCDEIQGYYFSRPLSPEEFYKSLTVINQ